MGQLGAVPVAGAGGRQHTYESRRGGRDGRAAAHCGRLGAEVLVQTNAVGSLRADWPPGSLMLVADHINFVQRSPLVGATGPTTWWP